MPDNFCANHSDRKAVGTCNKCGRHFCPACLDMDFLGQPICPDCLKKKGGESLVSDSKPQTAPIPTPPPPVNKAASKDPFEAWAGSHTGSAQPKREEMNPVPPRTAPAAMPSKPDTAGPAPAPSMPKPAASTPTPAASTPKPAGLGISPLNFKGKGLEDDPFGLFGAPAKPSPSAPATQGQASTDQVMDDAALASSQESVGSSLGHTASPFPASAYPTPPFKMEASPAPPVQKMDPPKMEPPKTEPPKINLPTRPSVTPAPAGPPKLTLGPTGEPTSKTMIPAHGEPPAPSLSVPTGFGEALANEPLPQTDPAGGKRRSRPSLWIIGKQWVRFYFEKWVGVLEPAAKKLHISIWILAVLVLLLMGGAIVALGALMPASAVKVVDSIPSLHIVEVTANQIGEMDITAYSEFQNQLQTMGFTETVQFTLPDLPSSNFMEVGMKPDVGTYSEIIKFPGSIAPKVSFVTVFTNGIWFSTNGWPGTNQQNNWQVSEFFPDIPVDQLYVKHVQRVQQMVADNDWQAQSMSEARYMAALSDQIRTYLESKKVPAYKANFEFWH